MHLRCMLLVRWSHFVASVTVAVAPQWHGLAMARHLHICELFGFFVSGNALNRFSTSLDFLLVLLGTYPGWDWEGLGLSRDARDCFVIPYNHSRMLWGSPGIGSGGGLGWCGEVFWIT